MEKQCIGIDVSKDSLDCCLGFSDAAHNQRFLRTRRFDNNHNGFAELLKWVKCSKRAGEPLFVMEATGVYYENLAYYLSSKGKDLSVLLPNLVKHYARSRNVKTKTDGRDAQVICQLGLERNHRLWEPPTKMMREIKSLAREYRELKSKITQSKNQLHAHTSAHSCPTGTKRRLEKLIALLELQALEIETELRTLTMADPLFHQRMQNVCTIPGVAFLTAICIVAEANGFLLVGNARRLASYAGLDIQQNQSGNKNGKTRLSKKGNSYIRAALYMSALSAKKHNPRLKDFYQRIQERKPAKKIAVAAVMRKQLLLIYTIWKNNTGFEPDYEQKKADRIAPACTG